MSTHCRVKISPGQTYDLFEINYELYKHISKPFLKEIAVFSVCRHRWAHTWWLINHFSFSTGRLDFHFWVFQNSIYPPVLNHVEVVFIVWRFVQVSSRRRLWRWLGSVVYGGVCGLCPSGSFLRCLGENRGHSPRPTGIPTTRAFYSGDSVSLRVNHSKCLSLSRYSTVSPSFSLSDLLQLEPPTWRHFGALETTCFILTMGLSYTNLEVPTNT